MMRSSRSRARAKRMLLGSGSRLMRAPNGWLKRWKRLTIAVSDAPISSASERTSASNSVFPTTAMVSAFISRAMSTVSPSRGRPHREVGHHHAVRLEPLAVERGLAEAPLARVELALARQEAFAQERLRPLDAPALHEVVLARDQHLADVVGVDEEVDL